MAFDYYPTMPLSTDNRDELYRRFIRVVDEKMGELDWSDADLNRAAKYEHPYINKVRSRRSVPKQEHLNRIAKALGVDPAAFFSDPPSTVPVAVHDLQAAAGDGAQVYDNLETAAGTLTFDRQYIRSLTNARPDQLMIIQAWGDSMEPTIPSEAWVMIDTTQTDVVDRRIYALRDGDDARIKRLIKHPTKPALTLQSDNDSWADITDVDPDRLHVIGRAIWFSKKLA